MQLAMVGMSHHSAPIAVRERLNYQEHDFPAAFAALAKASQLIETVILSTCNRVEVYAAGKADDPEHLFETIVHHLALFHNLPESEFSELLYKKANGEAVHHLFRVASGLDSIVLGEAQILGQVRHSLQIARHQNAAGNHLIRLFEQAISTGKRIQSETGLGRGGFSIGHAAVELAERIFDDFSHASILLLGAGKMSELTARHLVQSGVKLVVVANRTHHRAVSMAEKLGGEAIYYEEAFRSGLEKADIVISSTSAPHPIINRENLLPIVRRRKGKPLFLIDIALPRDVSPDVDTLNNVFLYNIDDLQDMVNEDAKTRKLEADKAHILVEEEAGRYLSWLRVRQVTPIVRDLRRQLENIRQEYLEIFLPRLSHLPEKDRKLIESLTEAMMDQVAIQPIMRLKQNAADSEDGQEPELDLMQAAKILFGLEEMIHQSAPNDKEGEE